jgi:hypothetical protein
VTITILRTNVSLLSLLLLPIDLLFVIELCAQSRFNSSRQEKVLSVVSQALAQKLVNRCQLNLVSVSILKVEFNFGTYRFNIDVPDP